MHRRLVVVMTELGAPWEAIYVNDGSRDASLQVVEIAAARRQPHRCGQPVAQLRQGDRHHCRPRPRARRRGDRDRRRPAGPARGHPPPRRRLARRLRHRLRQAPPARRRWLGEEGDRRGVLPRDAQPGRRAAAGERRRLPPDEPPRRRCCAADARAPSLHEGPVRLGRLPQHRRALRPRATRRRPHQVVVSGSCGIWRSRASPASVSAR